MIKKSRLVHFLRNVISPLRRGLRRWSRSADKVVRESEPTRTPRAEMAVRAPLMAVPLRGAFVPLLLTTLITAGCASAPRQAPRELVATNLPFAKDINAFADADQASPPPHGATLFIGSSSIRLWKTLAQDFPQHQVMNRGFGGSQIIDSVNYADRIVIPCRPKHIVMYAGGNDLNAGKSPAQVFADFRAFVNKIHTALPDTRISYISIAPNPARWSQVAKVREANRLIQGYTKHRRGLAFINVFHPMLGPDGLPRPEIFVADRLHMNEKGYKLWTRIVEPHLDQAP
jgi:lysophospholipase L1-like esterase